MCNLKRVYIPDIVKQEMLTDCPKPKLMSNYEQLVKEIALQHQKERQILTEGWFDFIIAEYTDKKLAFDLL